jgi:hypothetical protein
MIKRTLVIATAAAAFALGLGASRTAGAWPPDGVWENGTQHTGIALQGATLDGIKPQHVDVVLPKDGKQEPKK